LTSPRSLLLAVSIAYCALIFTRTSQSMALTFDESVYASQVGKDEVATMFTAPRARGMPWLLAPVAGITTSIFALRVYLTLLAGVLLYAAFQSWIATTSRERWVYSYVPAVAAACFASLWITILYGTMAYPNLWLTFALVGGLGYFCQATTVRSGAIWRPLTWVVVAFAAAATIRPTDALAAAVPLLLFPVVIRGADRLAPAMAVLGGLALGWSFLAASRVAGHKGVRRLYPAWAIVPPTPAAGGSGHFRRWGRLVRE
jgi:hypothetical protein